MIYILFRWNGIGTMGVKSCSSLKTTTHSSLLTFISLFSFERYKRYNKEDARTAYGRGRAAPAVRASVSINAVAVAGR